MTLDDLKNYKAVWREPLIGSYRGRTVITMPPPSSGGVALLQMLNVVEGYKFDEFKHNSAPYLHLLARIDEACVSPIALSIWAIPTSSMCRSAN